MTRVILTCILSICLVPFYIIGGAPIARRVIDMTYMFEKSTLHWPGLRDFELDVTLNGTIEINNVELWLQSEEYSTAVHSGTHMDAPAHFMKGGSTIDEVPVSSMIASAAVIDIKEKASTNPDAEVTVNDLLHWEEITGQSLNGKVILLRLGWGEKWGNRTAFYGTPEEDQFQLHFPGLNGEACQWLVNHRNIVGVGTEALSFDIGNTKDFPCHTAFLQKGIYGLENVANVDKLPLYGATLYIMPMKIAHASGAPTRIIATYPELIFKT